MCSRDLRDQRKVYLSTFYLDPSCHKDLRKVKRQGKKKKQEKYDK